MPYRDGTGPFGQGSMTGRGMGPCGQGMRKGFNGQRGRGNRRGFGLRRRFDFSNIKDRNSDILNDNRDFTEKYDDNE
jgi:hypothetical protein